MERKQNVIIKIEQDSIAQELLQKEKINEKGFKKFFDE